MALTLERGNEEMEMHPLTAAALSLLRFQALIKPHLFRFFQELLFPLNQIQTNQLLLHG